MGFGGIGPGSLLLIAVIVILLFGTKRLRHLGSDLGQALRGFRKGMKDEENQETLTQEKPVHNDKDETP